MNAIYLTLFVSTTLAVGSALLFGFLFHKRSHEHIDRLALLPLDDEPISRHGEKESHS